MHESPANHPVPNHFFEDLLRTLTLEMPLADALIAVKNFVYLREKALIYVQKGPEEYRRLDCFQFPRLEWDYEQLDSLERGCQQIVDWKGLTSANPLDDVRRRKMRGTTGRLPIGGHEVA